jgi:hypothetical protein
MRNRAHFSGWPGAWIVWLILTFPVGHAAGAIIPLGQLRSWGASAAVGIYLDPHLCNCQGEGYGDSTSDTGPLLVSFDMELSVSDPALRASATARGVSTQDSDIEATFIRGVLTSEAFAEVINNGPAFAAAGAYTETHFYVEFRVSAPQVYRYSASGGVRERLGMRVGNDLFLLEPGNSYLIEADTAASAGNAPPVIGSRSAEFSLTPIPEPGSALLLLSGFASCFLFAARRRYAGLLFRGSSTPSSAGIT